jgi:hypothetical protein
MREACYYVRFGRFRVPARVVTIIGGILALAGVFSLIISAPRVVSYSLYIVGLGLLFFPLFVMKLERVRPDEKPPTDQS